MSSNTEAGWSTEEPTFWWEAYSLPKDLREDLRDVPLVRWGRIWRKPPIPAGLISDRDWYLFELDVEGRRYRVYLPTRGHFFVVESQSGEKYAKTDYSVYKVTTSSLTRVSSLPPWWRTVSKYAEKLLAKKRKLPI